MFYHNINPVILSLGPLEIRWYGLVYVLGFFLAIWWLHYLAKKDKIEIKKEQIWDLTFYLMLGVLIGARLFMIFWEPQVFLYKPWNLLFIWQGGMSFHGGFVGIIVACWLYCRKKKLEFWQIADALSVPAIFALALGRIANFINGELWGTKTTASWCVDYSRNQYIANPPEGCRHPNMIYSFFQRMIVFGGLLALQLTKEWKPGFIFWNFVFWEGLGRIIVDFFRFYPQEQIFIGLSLGQWFSVLMVIVALYVFWKYYKEDWRQICKPKTFIKANSSS